MESTQQAQSGKSRPKKGGGGGGKGKVKRCSYCGAKNKAAFEYCIRCSEPLDDAAPEGIVAQDRATLSRLFVGGVAAVAVLAVAALMVRSFSGEPETSPSASAPSAAAASDVTPREAPVVSGIDSQQVLKRFNEGLAAFNQKDYAAAIEVFQDVLQEIPDNPSVHQYLGLSFFNQQQYPEAISALKAARDLRPDSFELLDHYVTVAKKAGDLESGAAALRDYIQRHPADAEPRLELSRIAREMGKPEEAMEQAAFLANAEGATPESKYEYGVSLKEAGKLDEAIAALQSAVELDPSSAVANHALGVTELLSGKPAQALGPLEQAVAKAPDNGDFRFSLAQAYEKLDRIPESLAAYEAYLQHAKDSDPRAKVVRERLEIAKKALAEQKQAGERPKSES